MCVRTQKEEIVFFFLFPIFVVYFQAALNDIYFTYYEEPVLPWSPETIIYSNPLP